MIKWLTEISVTTEESSNHFHYMDNRVLPEFVDAERATAEGWLNKNKDPLNGDLMVLMQFE